MGDNRMIKELHMRLVVQNPSMSYITLNLLREIYRFPLRLPIARLGWRLGVGGLDPEFLRAEQAKSMMEYSRRIVNETI